MKPFFKYSHYGPVALAAGAVLLYLLLPAGPRDPMSYDDPYQRSRPLLEAREHIVVTGMPYATRAALEVLNSGGNAFDAAVTGLLVLNVVSGEAASFPGIAPLLIYDARTRRVRSYTGAGVAPARATIEEFRRRGHEEVMPDLSILSQLVPASPDVIVALLQAYGTRSFQELSAPAIRIAREGFPVHAIMAQNLNFSLVDRLGFSLLLPYNADVYLKGEPWRPLHYGDRFQRPELADTLERLGAAEGKALSAGADRKAALEAVRAVFYEGEIAERIVALHKEKDGLMSAADLRAYRGAWEEPLRISFRAPAGDFTLYTNRTWNQGIAFLMMLNLVEAYGPERLRALGRNSDRYVHVLAQIIELAMADRDAYTGDPRFTNVPVHILLSSAYARTRIARLNPRAFPDVPAPGRLPERVAYFDSARAQATRDFRRSGPGAFVGAPGKDTTYLAIIDAAGNSVSLTPSDFPKSPMLPGTGLTLGNRMIQFRLDANSPNALQPGKRPRVTPHALMAERDGKFYMSFGTPGGDMQTQANLQFFLNHVLFGLDPQQAAEASRFRTRNFPDSFAPHKMRPSGLDLEAKLFAKIGVQMGDRGYDVRTKEDWTNHFGGVGAVLRADGRLLGAADPREGTWGAGR